MAFSWWSWQSQPTLSDAEYRDEIESLHSQVPVPALWLFGKTGSGKSSVVRYLTGADAATIGEGFRPETKASRRFDFPDSLEPLMTFIDTRGLGEAAYDPSEDIQRFSDTTQLMVVTVRVTDHALENLVDPLRRIRRSNPERPVILVLTCLHEATASVDLSDQADPFDDDTTSNEVPERLQVLIEEKEKQFSGLYDDIIPIDLTKPEDGFADPNFGGRRLKKAILDKLPHAYRQALLALGEADRRGKTSRQTQSQRQILASSALAGTAGAVPLPWVDVPAVLGIQAHLAVKIAKIYDQELTPARWAILSSAAGSRIALRLAMRSALKFIPLVGIAAGAATAFAFTYALGMSWDWYFADLRKGNVPNPDQLKRVFDQQLKRGRELWSAE